MNRTTRLSAATAFPAAYPVIALVGGVLFAAGCVGATRQLSAVDRAAVEAEARRQSEMAFDTLVAQTERLGRVAFLLRRAALEWCPEKRITPAWGYSVAVAETLPEEYRHGAWSKYGLADRPMFLFITPGSPMDAAGVRAGDVVVEVNGRAVRDGKRGVEDVSKRLDRGRVGWLELLRGEEPLRVEVTPTRACGKPASVLTDSSTNAFTDGESIFVTSGMLDYVLSDEELALVVGHEIGHIIGDHLSKQKSNALWGSVLGAALGGLVDGLSGSLGAPTYGRNARDLADAGAIAGARKFSQDFEREADLIGAEILAAANIDFGEAIDFWRRMSTESPGSVAAVHGASHPSTPERFVRLRELHARLLGPS